MGCCGGDWQELSTYDSGVVEQIRAGIEVGRRRELYYWIRVLCF